MKQLATLAVRGGEVGPLALDGDTVIFPLADRGSDRWGEVAAVDLRTKNQSTVARSAWPGGFINWAAGTGDWVAWVDQSHRQGDSDPNVLWRVWVTNTSSGRKRLLSTNGNMPDPFVPQVHATGGYVFWTQAEADRTAREYIWKAGAGAPRTALRHVEMTPGSETAADGKLVYLSRAAGRHTGHTVGGDCWAVPLDGHGPPKPLTHTALAMGCAAHAGWLVWSQHIDPTQKPLPPDGVLDDPYQIVSSKLDGSDRRTLHRGYLSTGYPVVGDGFVTWQSGASALVHALSSSARTKLPSGLNGTSLRAGDGSRLVYVSTGGGSTILHVANVTVTR